MFYLRLFLVIVWFIVVSVFGIIYSVLHWGNADTNRKCARLFAWLALKIVGARIEIKGEEFLKRNEPAVFIANHQSVMDLLVFGSIYPANTVIIGKKEIIGIPFFNLYYIASGNILIDRRNTIRAVAGLTQAVDKILKRKVSIWIFPEGTRNKSTMELLPFKRGAFHMAYQAKIPIIPIICSPLKPVYSWEERRLTPGVIKVEVLPPIEMTQWKNQEMEKASQEIREKMASVIRSMVTEAAQ